tara:strand:+ start:378 stop:800 length:423 start_codon:yes stop_codon:yes gene_type:complete
MNNSLLFNNIHYNKIIKKNVFKEHPNKNIFINIFILLIFIIILGLFLSYRYKCKQDIQNKTLSENIEKKNSDIEENTDLEKKNINNTEYEKSNLNTNENINKNDSLNNISIKNEKNILLDIQNNNFGNNLDDEDIQYHLL